MCSQTFLGAADTSPIFFSRLRSLRYGQRPTPLCRQIRFRVVAQTPSFAPTSLSVLMCVRAMRVRRARACGAVHCSSFRSIGLRLSAVQRCAAHDLQRQIEIVDKLSSKRTARRQWYRYAHRHVRMQACPSSPSVRCMSSAWTPVQFSCQHFNTLTPPRGRRRSRAQPIVRKQLRCQGNHAR